MTPQLALVAPTETGASGRVDGRLKATGAMPYAADIVVEGTLHVAVLRSPHPHARIASVQTAEAAAASGVRAVLTGADVASRLSGRGLRDVPILAVGKVRFAGEMVAAVAAETPGEAEQAVNLIVVDYEPLPAVFDVEEAARPDAPALHDDPASYPGAVHASGDPPNVISRAIWTHGEDVEQALARADHVFEHTFHTQKVHQGYIEPHCCTVEFDRNGRVRVWSCNKAPYKLREHLGATFDLAVEDIEAYSAAIGGDFGGKGSPMDIPLCLELSRRSGRPARMLRSYGEELLAGDPRHSSATTIRMGVSKNGRIQALDVRSLLNAGAYGGYRPGPKMATAPATSYNLPAARVEAIRVYTNEVPCGNARAPGAPQTTFAMEAMVELVAHELGMDPLEFRRLNVLREGQTSLMGATWPEVRGVQTLDEAKRHLTQNAELRTQNSNIRFGRGVAMYDRPTHAPQRTSLRLRLLPSGGLEAQVPIQETGTGSHTMLRGVIASALVIEPARIAMRYVGTTHLPYDEGVGGSRVTVSTAEAGVVTAQAFQRELATKAAERLGVPPEEVEAQPGGRCVHHASGREVTMEALANSGVIVEAVGDTAGNHAHGDAATSFCVQAAQVAVDVETGQVTLLDFLSVHDVAEILNPIAHRGQIEGGIAMGIGYALSEDLGLSEGRVTAAHLGDYKLPTMPDMPPLRVELLPGGRGVGARNVKSIGEIGNVPAAAAIANAVSDAIGVPMDSLPVTAEKVRAALAR